MRSSDSTLTRPWPAYFPRRAPLRQPAGSLAATLPPASRDSQSHQRWGRLPPTARKVLAVTALSLGLQAHALQVVEASDGVAVEAIVSLKEPTRIRIEGAAITDVFGNIHSSHCGGSADKCVACSRHGLLARVSVAASSANAAMVWRFWAATAGAAELASLTTTMTSAARPGGSWEASSDPSAWPRSGSSQHGITTTAASSGEGVAAISGGSASMRFTNRDTAAYTRADRLGASAKPAWPACRRRAPGIGSEDEANCSYSYTVGHQRAVCRWLRQKILP